MQRPVSPLLHDYKNSVEKAPVGLRAWYWFAIGLGLPLLALAGILTFKNTGDSQQPVAAVAVAEPETATPVSNDEEAATATADDALPLLASATVPTPEQNDAGAEVNPANETVREAPAATAPEFHPPMALPPEPVYSVVKATIKRGDTLEQLFRRNKLSLGDLAQIARLPDAAEHLRILRPGDELEIHHDDGRLMSLYRELGLTEALQISREDDAFFAELVERPIETRRRQAYGRIETSLFESAAAAGLKDKLIMNLAGIFAWDIDFVLDIRSGDDYYIVFEEVWQNGEFVTTGEIVAAEFNNNGRTFQAIRFTDSEGRSDYFTPEGRSVRKAFVRAPVDFTRISSSFNPRRRHPILNTIRAHKGVDYAAPRGTPIMAAGDGKVIFRGRKGGYGNAVILQHGGNITTLYAHMSSFAKNARMGQRVRQGQTIGFVGSSGLATAAHLHYEYRLNGVHRNPRTVQLPQADPIKDEYRNAFHAAAEPLLDELQRYKRTQIAAVGFRLVTMSDRSPGGQLFIGLISGTSMDGIDAALVEIGDSQCQLQDTLNFPYPDELRSALMHASRTPNDCTVDIVGHLDHWIGEAFRDAALALLVNTGTDPSAIAAIGSHGQTLRHQPRAERAFTLQIGDPNIIAAGTGITTVADFRRRDMALGGEGAPLAPAFHQWLLSDADVNRVALNIGGFSNITILPAGSGNAAGFDTGPGNSLLDLWCARHRGTPYDDNGEWAASGRCNDALLSTMLSDPYFSAAPPKSTGFEYFDGAWLDRHLQVADQASAEDVQATLAELTAQSIADAINAHAPATEDVFVCGGGAHNAYLLRRLSAAMPDRQLCDPGDFGIPADWIEAAAFAWLAARHLAGLRATCPP